MKIKFLSGPRAGQTEHVPNSQEYQVMASAGLIEIVPMAARGSAEWLHDMKERSEALNPPAQSKVTWTVKKGMLTERWAVLASCSRPNCSAFYFDGDPGQIIEKKGIEEGFFGQKVSRTNGSIENQSFIHSCSGTAPEKIPASICAEYRSKKKSENIATLGADEAHFYKNCQPSKGDGERVDLYAPQTINGVVVGPPVLFDHPINSKHNNYGWENALPSRGDGQPADLSAVNPVFKKK
jgi:hypothetical protein